MIRSVVAGAEIGDLDLACTIIVARVQKCMREGVAKDLRESRATMPMAPRVQSVVVEGAAREWRWRWRRRLFVLLCGLHITTNALV